MQGLGSIQVECEFTINATRGALWHALTAAIGEWWPASFYAGRDTEAFRMEQWPGGRVFEDAGEGRGNLWYTVISIEPPHTLRLSGQLFPGFGGPATSLLTLSLKGEGTACCLSLSDALFGAVDDSTASGVEAGWRELIERHLRPFAESRSEDEES